VVTLDAGGPRLTLTVEGGEPQLTNSGKVGRFTVSIPMIDTRPSDRDAARSRDQARRANLRVGPKSAGAEPGPHVYTNGWW